MMCPCLQLYLLKLAALNIVSHVLMWASMAVSEAYSLAVARETAFSAAAESIGHEFAATDVGHDSQLGMGMGMGMGMGARNVRPQGYYY